MYNQGATIELRKRASRHIVLDGVSHTSSLKNCDDFEAIVEAIASLEIEEEEEKEEDDDYEEYRDLNPDYKEYPENFSFHSELLDEIYG